MAGYEFTSAVRRVLMRGRDHAERLGHEYVGTEHILLALLDEPDGEAIRVLDHLDVSRQAIRDSIESVIKRGNAASRDPTMIPYTSRAKKVLELSMFAARNEGVDSVDTAELLLGLIDERMGIAAQTLAGLGVDGAVVTEALREVRTE